MARAENNTAIKVLSVLDVLSRNFFHGFTPGELAEATGYSPSDITRYVNTLETAGFAERVQETKRIRPSVRYAQHAVQILNAMTAAEQQLTQITQRINRG